MSAIGTPRMSSGSAALTAVLATWVRYTTRKPSVNPSTWLPQSPMNTYAGWLLYLRNPNNPPMVASEMLKISALSDM